MFLIFKMVTVALTTIDGMALVSYKSQYLYNSTKTTAKVILPFMI